MRAPRLDEVLPLFQEGDLPGVQLDVQEAAEWVAEQYGPMQQWCMVQHWVIASVTDLDQPHLYANCVLHDSAGRFAPGSWVRSSPAVEEPKLGVFRTRSTVYILHGRGDAAEVSLEALLAMH